MNAALAETKHGPWNPGLSSTIKPHLMPQVTIYDPANGLVSWEMARDLAEATGLNPQELATFRPERLLLHHVMIRVTAETHVPDGPSYADLGINLRSMAADIYAMEIEPRLPDLRREFEDARSRARTVIREELEDSIFGCLPVAEPKGLLGRLFGRESPRPPTVSRDERALAASTAWAERADDEVEPLQASCFKAMSRTVGAVLAHRGSLVLPKDILEEVAVNMVSNDHVDMLIARRVAPLFDAAAEKLGFFRLPPQSEPVVLNAKGASASGKSSIRSQQRRIAEALGIDWKNFAIISPDYWRKLLIDYDGLGDDYKYAAMLTGQELEIIDRKLDALMAQKASSGTVPHMLIDRFRFDSFLTARTGAAESSLLTRFGTRIYMFFLITPPEETVVRAWERGLETGRYKAVDDLLFHNIEAYSGMPGLFFAWARLEDRWVHYEFLDNSVPLGTPPRTIAFGQNGSFVVLDLERLCDVERFRHVDVNARTADQVIGRTLASHEAMAFVRNACAELAEVAFVVPGTDRVFARSTGRKIIVDTTSLPEGITPADLGPHEALEEDLGRIDPKAAAHVIGDLGRGRFA
ncbi:MAG: hypothetical protein OXH79_23285 [Boseongicola sp.]|nr:hypothetical protein [Boseongicola sp.]